MRTGKEFQPADHTGVALPDQCFDQYSWHSITLRPEIAPLVR